MVSPVMADDGVAGGRPGGGTARAGVARLSALARGGRAAPVRLRRLTALLTGSVPAADLDALVGLVFPDPADRAELERRAGATVDRHQIPEGNARLAALIGLIGERLFPVYDFSWWDEEIDADTLLEGIPFERLGWSYDDWHCLDEERHPGYNLLRAVVEGPWGTLDGTRVPLLEGLAGAGVPGELLAPLAGGGLPPDLLRARLGGGPFAAVCDFADWVRSDTGLAFLDFSDEDQLSDADWSPRNVALLTAQWPRARALVAGIDALCDWLLADRDARFAALLRAAGLLAATPATAGAATL